MDILRILKTSAKEVTPEDLLMFEDALTAGDYEDTSGQSMPDAAYRDQCANLISQIRNWKKHEKADKHKSRNGREPVASNSLKDKNSGVIIDGDGISPFNKPSSSNKTPTEEVASDLAVMRRSDDYKNRFKEYLNTSHNMTEEFIDENFSMFEQLELDCMLQRFSFSEEFLEKRFSQLSLDGISRYQIFSEDFFIRHFSDLDAETVLRKGVNPWRSKENRSSKLDVFLRLKGIRQ